MLPVFKCSKLKKTKNKAKPHQLASLSTPKKRPLGDTTTELPCLVVFSSTVLNTQFTHVTIAQWKKEKKPQS